MPTRWCSTSPDSQADPGQGRRRRVRPAGAQHPLRQLHLPQGRARSSSSNSGCGCGTTGAARSWRSIPTSPPTTWCGAAVLRDVRCRRALSLAIDRDEINQAIYFGLGVPRAPTRCCRRARSTSPNTPAPGPTLRSRPGQRAARRDGPDQARRRRLPPAARRQADDHHRRHRGRKHRRDPTCCS